jgi:hypothetical protein
MQIFFPVCNQRDDFLFPRCEKRFPKQPMTPLLDAYVHACFTIADVPMHAWCPYRNTRKACASICCSCTLTRSNVLASSPMEKVGEPVYVRYLAPIWAMGVLSVPGPPESVHAHAGDQIMLSTLGVESHGQACYDSQSGIILPGTCCFYQR